MINPVWLVIRLKAMSVSLLVQFSSSASKESDVISQDQN